MKSKQKFLKYNANLDDSIEIPQNLAFLEEIIYEQNVVLSINYILG